MHGGWLPQIRTDASLSVGSRSSFPISELHVRCESDSAINKLQFDGLKCLQWRSKTSPNVKSAQVQHFFSVAGLSCLSVLAFACAHSWALRAHVSSNGMLAEQNSKRPPVAPPFTKSWSCATTSDSLCWIGWRPISEQLAWSTSCPIADRGQRVFLMNMILHRPSSNSLIRCLAEGACAG